MVSPHLLVTLSINDIDHELALEPRRTLLDALRHDLQLTGTKKFVIWQLWGHAAPI